MKTKVEILHDDHQYQEYKQGERGYIDGYIRGGNDVPCCCVVIGERIVLVPFTCIKVTELDKK